MEKDKEYIAPGPSRALTRGPEVGFYMGTTLVKKLPYENKYLMNFIKNSTNRFSICGDKRCKTCTKADKNQINVNFGKLKMEKNYFL